jgi:hypothetical protein
MPWVFRLLMTLPGGVSPFSHSIQSARSLLGSGGGFSMRRRLPARSLRPMADAQVFVDDAVRGTLPEVCAKDGVPTTDQLRFSSELGGSTGLGVAWLLVLAGPLGWLGLVVIALLRSGSRSETLTVQLPLSEPAYSRIRALRRRRSIATGTALAGVVLGLWALASHDAASGDAFLWQAVGLTGAALAVASLIALAVADHQLTGATVSIDLDASRRWVTLRRVHPAFAAACRAHEQQRDHQRT